MELSRGDQLRRETQRRLLALRVEQERARECTFECAAFDVHVYVYVYMDVERWPLAAPSLSSSLLLLLI